MLPQYREKARQLAAGLQRMCVSKSLHQENLDVFLKEAEIFRAHTAELQ